MRILHVFKRSFPESIGGIEKFIDTLCKSITIYGVRNEYFPFLIIHQIKKYRLEVMMFIKQKKIYILEVLVFLLMLSLNLED